VEQFATALSHVPAFALKQPRHILNSPSHPSEASLVDYTEIITIDPERRSGKACIRDTRITVYDVLDYMASGMSQQKILADFPDLTETDILACLAFAVDAERRFEVVTI
jgi:uncharacterized protein (DUF433 family)